MKVRGDYGKKPEKKMRYKTNQVLVGREKIEIKREKDRETGTQGSGEGGGGKLGVYPTGPPSKRNKKKEEVGKRVLQKGGEREGVKRSPRRGGKKKIKGWRPMPGLRDTVSKKQQGGGKKPDELRRGAKGKPGGGLHSKRN